MDGVTLTPQPPYSEVVGQLQHLELLPETMICAFATGSLVRGWGNATSDLDVVVISEQPWTSTTGATTPVLLDPPALQWEHTRLGDLPLEVEYWTVAQLDECLGKFAPADKPVGAKPWVGLSHDERSFLERIPYGRPLAGDAHVEHYRQQFFASTFTHSFLCSSFDTMDGFVEDAIGQAEAGDVRSAVLSVRLAFGHCIDALLADAGQYGSRWPKWQARRFAEARQSIVSDEEYWGVQTMADYDPADPAAWVSRVARICQRVATHVTI